MNTSKLYVLVFSYFSQSDEVYQVEKKYFATENELHETASNLLCKSPSYEIIYAGFNHSEYIYKPSEVVIKYRPERT